MVRYSYEKWTRVVLGVVAFGAALLLTPRALLEVPEHADSHEIPVNMLDRSDECLWCTPVEPLEVEVLDCEPGHSLDNETLWLGTEGTEDQDCDERNLDDDRSV